jgi:hypothetical protein
LLLKHWNAGSPPDHPRYTCILFGEDGYFLDDENKTNGPLNGFRFVLHGDDESEEGSEDESTAEEELEVDSIVDTQRRVDEELRSLLLSWRTSARHHGGEQRDEEVRGEHIG